ncbi:MAG TPA: hypothetical protein VIU41_13375 [Geobacteraceae bacterium]
MRNNLTKFDKIICMLALASLVLYGLDYLFYGRAAEIGFGFLGNLAFLPIYVLFVTLMIERILKEREQSSIRQKLNMVIGVFFSEVGTSLLKDCFGFLRNGSELAGQVRITPQWQNQDFARLADLVKGYDFAFDCSSGDLDSLKHFLVARRDFLLALMGNPNLLEHDDFTDLLWSVFHLLEELEARQVLHGLPAADLDHLAGDIRRVFGHLLRGWAVYLRHLKEDYPYLFSLAVRKNPLNPEARVEIG